MRDRPILFQGAMVRALLAGTKTQTRREVKARSARGEVHVHPEGVPIESRAGAGARPMDCPYGWPGDRLWVREAFRRNPLGDGYLYRATDGDRTVFDKWTPSIHMPRAASRITLEITGVRVEKLGAITSEDAAAEGWPEPPPDGTPHPDPLNWYRQLWASINGQWEPETWVWVIQFRRA